MAAFVLDCSMAISWFLPDENPEHNEKWFNLLIEGEAIAPSLWPMEIANTLLTAQNRKRITGRNREKILHELEHLPIQIDKETLQHVWHDTSQLAEEFNLTIYDAIYLELAQRLQLPLATYDKALKKASEKLNLPKLS